MQIPGNSGLPPQAAGFAPAQTVAPSQATAQGPATARAEAQRSQTGRADVIENTSGQQALEPDRPMPRGSLVDISV